MNAREAGFTLVESLVGAAIGVILIWGLLTAANRLVFSAASLNARLVAQSGADRLTERLSAEAESAWAVWTPANTEIDFFSEDGSHRQFDWSYTYDPAQKTVTRSTGETYGPFDGFNASAVDVTALANPSASGFDPLFANSAATSVRYPLPEQPDAIGGNTLVALHLVGSGVDRTDLFASGMAPTAFTVLVVYTPSPTPATTATPIPLR